MLQDRYGNRLSTRSVRARDAYVEAVDRFLAAGPGVEEAFSSAIAADESFALAHLGLARHRHATGQAAAATAPLAAARAASGSISSREAGHINAIGLLIEGRGADAYGAVRSHLVDHPRDAMVAQTCVGVFGLIGFSGRSEREAELLDFTTSLAADYGDDWWFLAQHAFAQVETGQTGPAEATIERSLAGNPRNANAAHIRSHLYYENGEADAGFAWLCDWRRDYDRSALLHCHISWHVALWALERGDVDEMWRVVDQDLDPGSAWGPALNVLTDMAAILYRAELAGIHVPPERWRTVSRYAAERFPKPGIAFADAHAALAHAMAGNGAALSRIIAEARGPAGEVVRALAEGFGAIAAADWPAAFRHLRAALADHARIGGSRAQRDLVEFAMASVLLKQGRADEARQLLTERRPRTSQWKAVAEL